MQTQRAGHNGRETYGEAEGKREQEKDGGRGYRIGKRQSETERQKGGHRKKREQCVRDGGSETGLEDRGRDTNRQLQGGQNLAPDCSHI
jgi:hypothetical protein